MARDATTDPGPRSRPREEGLTLVELMVSIAIFMILGLFVMLMTKEALSIWKKSEHRRRAYENAHLITSLLAEDISAAFTREPFGVDEIKARFLVDGLGQNGSQRVMFVRTIEGGPERTVTYFSGAGRRESYYDLFDNNKDGKVDNGLPALGGLAEVVYFVQDGTLYRGVRSPVGPSPVKVISSGLCVPLAENVLYFGVQLWTQHTTTWDETAKPSRTTSAARGAERIWDSTRGYANLKAFLLHRGNHSLTVAEDDVFPEKIRVTLVLEGDRTERFTTLKEDFTDGDSIARVASVQGFTPPQGGDWPIHVKIRDEWVRIAGKGRKQLIVDEGGRAVRGSVRASHPPGATVRIGRTFTQVFYLPCYKEDWSDDREFARRQGVRYVPR